MLYLLKATFNINVFGDGSHKYDHADSDALRPAFPRFFLNALKDMFQNIFFRITKGMVLHFFPVGNIAQGFL